MAPGRGPLQLLRQVAGHSGWRYALYLGIELTCYGAIASLRRFWSPVNATGTWLTRPSRLAGGRNIPVRHIGRINRPEAIAQVRELAPDLILSLRFSQIMKKPFLAIPPLGVLNFHPSMLPQYAGLGSVFQALRQGASRVGCTVHLVDEGIDTGRVVVQDTVEVHPGDSVSRVCLKAYHCGGHALLQAVERLAEKEAPAAATPQAGSYYSWPKKEEVEAFRRSGGRLLRLKDLITACTAADLEQAL